MALRNLKLLASKIPSNISRRCLSHYPIDESIFGLTEEQQQVRIYYFI